MKNRIEQAPASPVAFEFKQIQAKDQQNKDSLIPLMFEGDYGSAFPAGVPQHFVCDFRHEEEYYLNMAQLAGPNQNLGLIPRLYGLRGEHRQMLAYKAHKSALEGFDAKLRTLGSAGVLP
jgi:hypothetical protein